MGNKINKTKKKSLSKTKKRTGKENYMKRKEQQRLEAGLQNSNTEEAPTTSTATAPPIAVEAPTSSETTSAIIYEHTTWEHGDLLSLSRSKTPESDTEALVLPPAPDPELAPSQDPLDITVKTEAEVASFEGSKMGRRLKSAENARKRRAEMTEEQRKEVLEKMAARHAALRSRETPEQRDQRLARQRKLSKNKYRAKIQKEDAARRKEVFDELAAEGKIPQKKAKKDGGNQGEKRFPVRYYKRLADEGKLLVPSRSVRQGEPGPSFIQTAADGSVNEPDPKNYTSPGYHYDECERFGLMIAAEIRNIDDLAERESVMSAIQNIIYQSVMRRRQKVQESQAESEPEPEITLPKPIDDRTEDEIAVASIKQEPESSDNLIFFTLPPNQNQESQPDIAVQNPIDTRTEEEMAIAAIKEEPVEPVDNTIFFTDPPSHNLESQPDIAVPNPIADRTEEMASQIFLTHSPYHSQNIQSETDPLPDITIPKPINDNTEAVIAVAAIKDEPVETYEITISDANMSI